jgi:DNA primase
MIAEPMDQIEVRAELTAQERAATLKLFNRMCHTHLLVDKKMTAYLEERKISRSTIDRFMLGSLPSVDRLRAQLGSNGFRMSLVGHDENGKLISKFSDNPLIIPIFDQYGSEVAVIGRAVCSDEEMDARDISKYNNTSFKKGDILFGLNLAIDSIRDKDKVYIVEGNFDVITAHQSGFRNVVATSGTMFTMQQLVILSRYTKNIVLLFDNDASGQEAADTHINNYKNYGVNIRKGNVPTEFKDLDEYLKSKAI